MTGSSERSALEPDLVPLHQRIRQLHLRNPDDPIPESEVKSLRKSATAVRPGSRDLLKDRTPNSRKALEASREDRRAAQAALVDMVRAAAPSTETHLERLSHQLRDLRYHWSLRIHGSREPVEIGIGLHQTRTIAIHLLRNGVTAVEVLIGLDLIAPVVQDADVELLRELALLQGDYGSAVAQSLKGTTNPSFPLYWLAVRSAWRDRYTYTDALAALSTEAVDVLLDSLSVAETVTLIEMMSFRSHTPKWFKGNRRLAAVLTAAADDPRAFGEERRGLMAVEQIREDLRYGHSALLGFDQGQRAAITGALRAVMLDPETGTKMERAMARNPQDSDLFWLHRQIALARNESDDFPSGLAIRVAVPSTSAPERTHLLLDGVPLATRLFNSGFAGSRDRVLDPKGGLRAGAEPHEVWIAEADCTEGCCGALRATISRDAEVGLVVWEVDATRGSKVEGRFEFDVDAYDAEVARAEADHSWEWPARRAARLLEDRLRAEPELLIRWGCGPGWARSWNYERTKLRLFFSYPEPPNSDRPCLQFEYVAEMPDAAVVDDEAVNALVDRIAGQFRGTDPKSLARVCGGSKENAEALGYAWPPSQQR